MDYRAARESGTWPRGRLDANTHLVASWPEEVRLIYYGAPIVTWFSDGRIQLDSCNKLTASTKNRMNKTTGLTVFHSRKVPYVLAPNMNKKIVFYDGITFKDGVLVNDAGEQIQPPTILEFS